MKPGDVVVGVLEGAVVLVGILTTRPPKRAESTDYAFKTGTPLGCGRNRTFTRTC